MPAQPIHHTGTVDATWDGPAAAAALPDDQKTWAYCSAWHASGNDADGDGLPDNKGDYKAFHHARNGGPANLGACRNIMAILGGARGGFGSDVPQSDLAGIAAHARSHMEDAATK